MFVSGVMFGNDQPNPARKNFSWVQGVD